MSDPFAASIFFSPLARRLGLKPLRRDNFRENSRTTLSSPSPACEGTLSACLQAGFTTALSAKGVLLLMNRANHTILQLDTETSRFVPADGDLLLSGGSVASIHQIDWACTTPIFHNALPPSSDPTLASFFTVIKDELSFECVPESRLPDLYPLLRADSCTGFEKSADDSFNHVLSRPIHVDEMHTEKAFRDIFPLSHADPKPNGFESAHQSTIEDDDIGRIIISYRHQQDGSDRITLDDWACAHHTVLNVMRVYGWKRARFWTDAGLRQYKAAQIRAGNDSLSDKWAVLGIAPYKFGPVVVLNLARKPGLVNRFWLTIERKTGAFHYGTWLTDDTGDLYMYLLGDDEEYPRAIITSVSQSQKLTWPSDRDEVLDSEWGKLKIRDADSAVRMLKENDTFFARIDFAEDELFNVEFSCEDSSMGWCGDVEALIDPPCLMNIFGSVGDITHEYKTTFFESKMKVRDTTVVMAFIEFEVNSTPVYILKRLYIDQNEGIRARSTPRSSDLSVFEHFRDNDYFRILNTSSNTPKWLQQEENRRGSL